MFLPPLFLLIPPPFIAKQDVTRCGISLGSLGISCPAWVTSQLSCTPSLFAGVRGRKGFDSVWALLSSKENIPVLTMLFSAHIQNITPHNYYYEDELLSQTKPAQWGNASLCLCPYVTYKLPHVSKSQPYILSQVWNFVFQQFLCMVNVFNPQVFQFEFVLIKREKNPHDVHLQTCPCYSFDVCFSSAVKTSFL